MNWISRQKKFNIQMDIMNYAYSEDKPPAPSASL